MSPSIYAAMPLTSLAEGLSSQQAAALEGELSSVLLIVFAVGKVAHLKA